MLSVWIWALQLFIWCRRHLWRLRCPRLDVQLLGSCCALRARLAVRLDHKPGHRVESLWEGLCCCLALCTCLCHLVSWGSFQRADWLSLKQGFLLWALSSASDRNSASLQAEAHAFLRFFLHFLLQVRKCFLIQALSQGFVGYFESALLDEWIPSEKCGREQQKKLLRSFKTTQQDS